MQKRRDAVAYCEASEPVTSSSAKIQVWQASRASADAAFGNARRIDVPGAMDVEGDPSITDDERTLVYASGNDSDKPANLVLVERSCL